MKLIICAKCHDIVKLTRHWRKCRCRASAGRYLEDNDSAEIAGQAVPFGIGNGYFEIAYKQSALFFGWFYGDLVSDHNKIRRVAMPERIVQQEN